MLRLNNKDLVPPSDSQGRHFRYRHAETGHVSEGRDFISWVSAAKTHRRANGLSIPADFVSQMEDQLCGDLPPEWCAQSGKSTVDTGFSFGDVVDWIKAVANRFTSGSPLVSQEEASRRARICTGCFLNMNAGGCGSGCAKLTKYLTPGMAARVTPYDELLKNCGVCRCYGRVQVHFPMSTLDALDTPEKQELYPEAFCWKSHRSPNYRRFSEASDQPFLKRPNKWNT